LTNIGLQESEAISSTKNPSVPKIAYIVSGFPNIYETFILYDILTMEKLGVAVELYPLRRQYPQVIHPEAERWTKLAHYHPFLSLAVLRAQGHFIRRNPLGYLRLLAEVCQGTWGSANFFLGAVAIFPKAVLFALQMNTQRITHVHAHFANHPAVSALIIHRLTGIPFSFTARGSDVQVDRRMLKEKVEAAQFVITVSADNKQIMVDECGPSVSNKIHVIYGGVDVDRLSPQFTNRTAGPLKILCVARLEEVKGHTYLVEACRILRQRGVAFECRLVGEGPLFKQIEMQIKQTGLGKEIQLVGPLSYQEVIKEMARADVVVLQTAPTAQGDREGIPNVLKEAMACGLPVVACGVGGIPELVDHERTGILVALKNPDALADALQRLYEDSALRTRLGRAGREKIVQEFNLKSSTTKRAQLFLGSPVPQDSLPTGHNEEPHFEVDATQSS
jgi:colanic acid/amylovoran biosynthesis glycosyltransferase